MAMPRKKPKSNLIQTVEESTELLRRLPVQAWAWWICGTLPFVCALLHFWNRMSRAANAWERLGTESLILALLYVLMKVCHAFFADHLMRQLRGGKAAERLPFRGWLRLFTSQALIHCSMPWVLTLASIAMVPFGWAYAAYHNASLLTLQVLREGGRTRDILRLAVQQSHFQPGQNHGLIMIIMVFAMIVWMNLMIGLVTLASISTAITGSENMFTRNPFFLMSSGVMAATICLAYLITGPLVKAIYALRCFQGLSVKTGEDLIVKFRRAGTAMAAVFILGATGASAAEAPARSAPEQLQNKIQEVLQEDDFQWRLPRQDNAAESGWIHDFVKAITNAIHDMGKSLSHWVDEGMVQWIKRLLRDFGRHSSSDGAPSQQSWATMVQPILWALLIVLGVTMLVILFRQWRRLPPRAVVVPTTASAINLESDAVVASQLPESEWMRLAQEKMASGDYRLAMRALFLATLAHLGERQLIAVSRSKSNGDYRRELSFRARGRTGLQAAFDQSVNVFDWAWYGWHAVTKEILDRFLTNHQTIIADASAS